MLSGVIRFIIETDKQIVVATVGLRSEVCLALLFLPYPLSLLILCQNIHQQCLQTQINNIFTYSL